MQIEIDEDAFKLFDDCNVTFECTKINTVHTRITIFYKEGYSEKFGWYNNNIGDAMKEASIRLRNKYNERTKEIKVNGVI